MFQRDYNNFPRHSTSRIRVGMKCVRGISQKIFRALGPRREMGRWSSKKQRAVRAIECRCRRSGKRYPHLPIRAGRGRLQGSRGGVGGRRSTAGRWPEGVSRSVQRSRRDWGNVHCPFPRIPYPQDEIWKSREISVVRRNGWTAPS